jgi:hypothetical protein
MIASRIKDTCSVGATHGGRIRNWRNMIVELGENDTDCDPRSHEKTHNKNEWHNPAKPPQAAVLLFFRK